MSDWVYTIHVCPFCGAPVEHEGGYEGYGWDFECEHESWSEEYGSVDPLEITVSPAGIEQALAAVAPVLEAQRVEKAARDAERVRLLAEKRAAMSPEERERSDRIAAMMNESVKNLAQELSRSLGRQVFGRDPDS